MNIVWIHKFIFPVSKNNFDILVKKSIKMSRIEYAIAMPRQNCTSHKNVIFSTFEDFWPYTVE